MATQTTEKNTTTAPAAKHLPVQTSPSSKSSGTDPNLILSQIMRDFEWSGPTASGNGAWSQWIRPVAVVGGTLLLFMMVWLVVASVFWGDFKSVFLTGR
jgi:hypothetical protein